MAEHKISRRLRRIRATYEWSQEELADALGTSRVRVVQLEGSGPYNVSGSLARMIDALEDRADRKRRRAKAG